MSSLKPSILVSPAYTTNNIDTQQAGWYQVSPNAGELALRVNYTDIGISGEIRLNVLDAPPKFQGYDGFEWVDFNSTQGPEGPPGQNFINAVNFNNLPSNTAASTEVPLASIFATTYINVGENLSNVNIRSLEGGTYDINSNLSSPSIILGQNSNVITISAQPLPYTWDFTEGKNTVSYLKNINSGWGENSRWVVQEGSEVVQGQAVRLTKDLSSSNIVIVPVTYSSLTIVNPFTTPFNMLGIATENASGGEFCVVCTKGITTALCTSNITTDFILTTEITTVGLDGIVGKDGGIFATTNIPTVDYIRAGYFLETSADISIENKILFYVDPKVQFG